MRLTSISLLFLFIVFSFHSTLAQNDKRLKGVEKDMESILAAAKAPGFAVAVVEKDKVIYARGFGYSDYENKVPANENTLYAIGSSTKAFTSGVLGQLRKDDKLKFDDSPRDYISELKFFNDELNNHVIIKDLMSHRTGLPRHDYSWYLFPGSSKIELVKRLEYQEPFTGVRKQWYYNNFMFLLQGVIAERITGKTWEENIRERFFKPLGMNRSNLSIDELTASSNIAVGYVLKKDSIIEKTDYYKIGKMGAAGSINSSVQEMSNWVMTWINGGKYKDTEILPAEYVKEAISSQSIVSGALPSEEEPSVHLSNYGYGWFLSSYKGHYRVQHGGNIDGFSANVAFFPSDSIGIVVLANQGGSAVPWLARNIIADRMLKTKKTDWVGDFIENKEKNKAPEKEEPETQPSRVPGHPLMSYTGTYNFEGYGSFEIDLKSDSLYAKFPLETVYLRSKHFDIFEAFEVKDGQVDFDDENPTMITFTTGMDGEISAAEIQLEPALDEPIRFKRSPKSIDVEAATLDQYVGEYELAGITIKIYLKGERTLYAFVEGQPEYELIATDIHKFSFKTLEGFKLEFLETGQGQFHEVNVIQPNGTFKATRKSK